MPALTDVDLSGVAIAAYSGYEGPGGTWITYYPADGVPNFAFCNQNMYQGKTSLNSIILPASITSIGNSAFKNCEGLSTINVPPLVTSIGNSAFSYCKRLIAINIPSLVTSIGD